MTAGYGKWEELWDATMAALRRAAPLEDRLRAVCELLRSNVPHYDWVGFYIVDPNNENELYLGPYAGAPTEHTRIPFGRGVCGRAAAARQTVVVDDVARETDYLACSPAVRSEVVVPILIEGKVWGELDIDSHEVAAFGEDDVAFLTRLCDQLALMLAAA